MDESTQQRRLELTQQIMMLLDSWGASAEQKVVLLGLPDEIKARKLERYRKDEAFPETDQVNEHISHLVGIADALRTSFPRNVEMFAIWMQQPHKRFDNQTPLALMAKKGLHGLIQVRSQLDCAFAWNASGSQ